MKTSDFMKWPITKHCGVLYIDGEMPLGNYRERARGFIKDRMEKPFLTLSHENFFSYFESDLSITSSEVQKALLEFLGEHPEIGLVIIDNLGSLTRIREDKSDDWREFILPFLIACRRRGVAVLLVHHAGKNGDQRGTGAREDCLDAVVKLSRAEDGESDGAHFKVEFTKARGVFGKEADPFIARLVNAGTRDVPVFSWEVSDVELNTEKRLLKLIRDCDPDGISVMEACKELDVVHSTISKAKKKLLADDLIKKGKFMKVKSDCNIDFDRINEPPDDLEDEPEQTPKPKEKTKQKRKEKVAADE